MRYVLTSLGLFLLLAVFVRSWYVHQYNDLPPKTRLQKTLNQPSQEASKVIFADFFILDDNLLLKPNDYKVIKKVADVLHKKTHSKLIILVSEVLNAPKIKNTITIILEDQGIKATRFQFLRKPSKIIGHHKVLFRVL